MAEYICGERSKSERNCFSCVSGILVVGLLIASICLALSDGGLGNSGSLRDWHAGCAFCFILTLGFLGCSYFNENCCDSNLDHCLPYLIKLAGGVIMGFGVIGYFVTSMIIFDWHRRGIEGVDNNMLASAICATVAFLLSFISSCCICTIWPKPKEDNTPSPLEHGYGAVDA